MAFRPSPEILKDLITKSNGQAGLNFHTALKFLVNVILEGKVPFELRPYFFGAKLVALKKPDGRLRPIAVGNIFSQLFAKCAGYHVLESRQARYGNRQVGVGTKRCTELPSHVFGCLMKSPQPKENDILKIDFENALNSMNRQFMQEKIFKYTLKFISTHTQRTVIQVFFLYGDSAIKSCEGTQQGDPESPALFSDSIQDLFDSLESKINLVP